MKTIKALSFSSLYTGVMLFLLYHIVLVRFPYWQAYVPVQRIMALILAVLILPKIPYIRLPEKTGWLLGIYLALTLLSAAVNEGHYDYTHPLVSGSFYVLAVLEVLAVFSYVIRVKGLWFAAQFLFFLSTVYVLINDWLIWLDPYCFYPFGRYYFLGNKFAVSYKHLEIMVLYMLTRRKFRLSYRHKLTLVVLAAVSLLAAVRVNCMTGAVGIFLLTILLIAGKQSFLAHKPVMAVLIMMAGVFPFAYDYVMGMQGIQYIIVNILHRTKGLTGRVQIFDALPQILQGHLLLGYGHNTAYEVWITATDWYPNAQNGFWNCVCEQGLPAAVLLSVLAVMSVWKSRKGYAVLAVVYVYAFLGAVEITMDIVFITWVILLYVIKEAEHETAACQRHCTGL